MDQAGRYADKLEEVRAALAPWHSKHSETAAYHPSRPREHTSPNVVQPKRAASGVDYSTEPAVIETGLTP